MKKWKPISKAPRDGTPFIGRVVVAFVSKSDGVYLADVHIGQAFWVDGDYRFESLRTPRPTHWIDMPDNPEHDFG